MMNRKKSNSNPADDRATRNSLRSNPDVSANGKAFARLLKESLAKQNQRVIKDRILSFHGKNYVVDYQDKFKF